VIGTSLTHPPTVMAAVPDHGGTPAPEIALAGESLQDGSVLVQVKDASTAAVLKNLFFGSSHIPTAVLVVDDFAGTTAPEIGLVGRDRATRELRIQIKDATSGLPLGTVFPERD